MQGVILRWIGVGAGSAGGWEALRGRQLSKDQKELTCALQAGDTAAIAWWEQSWQGGSRDSRPG